MRLVLSTNAAPAVALPLVTRHVVREQRRHCHILVVEDTPVNQRLVIRLLEKQEHTVVAVDNGRQAVRAHQAQSFDLVLMDVQMPEMDGLEATRTIRTAEQTTGQHVPIIAMTAHAMQKDRDNCLAAGMDEYLTKPMKPELLYTTIERVLSQQPNHTPDLPAPPVNLDSALQTAHGDHALLLALAKVFANGYPSLLKALRQAIQRGDGRSTAQAAHTLKGILSPLGAAPAQALATDLKTMGHTGNLQNALAALEALAPECERINTFFMTLGESHNVSAS
jgi:two-component system, sensor histidine kinase and response regulator